ncbi:MAG: ATP-binding protein [Gammaproteobacteria bacterium]
MIVKPRYRSPSLMQRILIAFALVVLPLVAALVTAILAVERLAVRSERAVLEAAELVEASRLLVEQVTAMERSARQHQVLGEGSLHELYLGRRRGFTESAKALAQRKLNAAQRADLDKIIEEERAVYDILRDVEVNTAGEDRAVAVLAKFPALGKHARAILADSHKSIVLEVAKMHTVAADVQRTFAVQSGLALITAVTGLAWVGASFITRPIRQIDQAVRSLGEGDLLRTIRVTGPRDLEELGDRLDWLRLRLLELNEHKTTLLQHTSHELKTPLTAIREGVQLLSERVVGELNASQTEVLQIVGQNSLQLQRQIEDLLNFSAITQTPSLFLDREPLRLDLLTKTVLKAHKVSLNAKALAIKAGLDPVELCGDRQKLKAIVDNLVSNAIKYSPVGGSICVTLSVNGAQAILDIQDEGHGIAPVERDKVFEAFYQGRAPYQGPVDGTGLGLSITLAYVKAHNGTIAVVDQTPGAHLRVVLPVQDVPNATSAEAFGA